MERFAVEGSKSSQFIVRRIIRQQNLGGMGKVGMVLDGAWLRLIFQVFAQLLQGGLDNVAPHGRWEFLELLQDFKFCYIAPAVDREPLHSYPGNATENAEASV